MERALQLMPVAGRPTRQRVLDAIRWYFRAYGLSPSHSEIAKLACIAVKRVLRYLKELQAVGLLLFTRGAARSIVLVDRCANLSDEEMERGCHARNWQVIKPPPEAAPLNAVFQISPDHDGVANWGLKLLDKLSDIPGTRGG